MAKKWFLGMVLLFLVAGFTTAQAPNLAAAAPATAQIAAGQSPAQILSLPATFDARVAPQGAGTDCALVDPCHICCKTDDGRLICSTLCTPS